MSYDQNYSGYCSNCGSSGGCNCSGGHEYSACSPDYNPVTVNNSTCPNIDGSTGTGGGATASGNNSSVHVSVCGPSGCCDEKKDDCCCKDGIKKLVDYLYKRSLDEPDPSSSVIQTYSMCFIGDLIPSNILFSVFGNYADCGGILQIAQALPVLPGAGNIKTAYITNDVVKSTIPAPTTISLCAVSIIKFVFRTVDNPLTIPIYGINQDDNLRKEFFYTPKCKCCCDCSDGIANALYFSGLGNNFTITIQDTLNEEVNPTTIPKLVLGTLGPVILVAINSDIAIFSKSVTVNNVTQTVYYGVPTCRIAKFVQILP